VQRLYGLPNHALIDMGDFVGATLEYLRRQPVQVAIVDRRGDFLARVGG
jgi:cobalt-precorrin-5B (C1)-methyltransferase